MFRRGGSAAKGTGITSGLEPRTAYQVGSPGILIPPRSSGTITGISQDLIKNPVAKLVRPQTSMPTQRPMQTRMPTMQDEMKAQRALIEETAGSLGNITRKQGIEETLDALAAAAPETGKRQSIAEFAKKFGTTRAGLERQREAAKDKFRAEATMEVIKNMNKDDRTALARNIQYLMSNDPKLTYQQALKIALGQTGKSEFLKRKSPQARIEERAVEYVDDFGEAGALTVAEFWTNYYDNKYPEAKALRPQTPPVSFTSGANIIATADAKEFKTGTNYVSPQDGGIYTVVSKKPGEGGTSVEMKKVWPVKKAQ